MIFSTHPLHGEVTRRLQAADEYCVASSPTPEALCAEGRGADVVVVRAPIPPGFLEGADRLRAFVRHGAGLDMIPAEAATAAGVLIANVPGVNARSVAEHAVFGVMALLRRFRMVDRDLRVEGWAAARAHAEATHELAGRRLGVVGVGSVGREVARIGATGFGLAVAGHTPRPEAMPEGVAAMALDDLVGWSDILVLACPLTEATRGLLGPERLARMRPGAILVNVARGPVVDEAALVTALAEGRIAGAVLDVVESPPLAEEHALLGFDNVVLTPHVAGITDESMRRMGEGAADETMRVLAGELPHNLCNPEAVAAYRQRFPA